MDSCTGMPDENVVEVTNLEVGFRDRKHITTVVREVSFHIRDGETLALVGESGCGKSVTALALTRLLPSPPAVYAGGRVMVAGQDVATLGRRALRALCRSSVSYVFQDPASALNPVYTVGFQMREALPSGTAGPAAAAAALLQQVGIPDPHRCLTAYPHTLSGGMQQRVVTAMALASQPRLIVADEPTTALDVTIQAQVLELLEQIRQQRRMAMLLITHNLGLVGDLADRVCVMYAGRIVETGATLALLRRPRHPYTVGLIGAVPRLGGDTRKLAGIPGQVPSPDAHLPGCVFADRCRFAQARCREEAPLLRDPDGDGVRQVRCHFPVEIPS